MYKRSILAMICVFTFLLSGCGETVKGIKKDVSAFPQNVVNNWHQAQKTDKWMQENLW